MKRIAIVLLIIILITLLIIGGYFIVFNNKNPKEPSGDTSGDVIKPLMKSETINIETVKTETETIRRRIDVGMPAFTNLSDFTFENVINKKIADSINPYIDEISIVSDESTTKTYKYTVSFERYNNEDYISLVVLQNYYTGIDGMRSNVWKDTYTVDVVKNKEVSLADICNTSNYKKIIVAEVNKQANEKNIKLISGNGLANIPDTQRFYIKDNKLYIYFEPASIAPYLDGELIFEMPYEFVNGEFILE